MLLALTGIVILYILGRWIYIEGYDQAIHDMKKARIKRG